MPVFKYDAITDVEHRIDLRLGSLGLSQRSS